MIEAILLAVVVVELGGLLWAVWPRPVAPPVTPLPKVTSKFTAEDRRIEALIQAVDPVWQLGDNRSHVTLVPDANGQIVEAKLR